MNWKGQKVLVTGGLGFIGSHLVDRLVELEANVGIADIRFKECVIPPGVEKIECDLSSIDEVRKVVKDYDFVFHLAAMANNKVCEENPDKAFRFNVQATFNILNTLVNQKIKKFVFTSAASLYGKYPKYVPIDEGHPVEPFGLVYLMTKRISEQFCDFFREKYNIPTVYFRLFTVYGPRQIPEYLIPTTIVQAIKNNHVELWNDKPTRDFIYVSDVVNALVKGAESDFCGGPLNIGYGEEIKIADIVSKIVENVEKLKGSGKIEVRYLNKEVMGPMRLFCNNTKAKDVINWKPEVTIDEGLKKTIKFYFENKEMF